MNLLADREEFVLDHRSHGPLAAEATDPVIDGYLLTVANNVLLDAINRGISEASLPSAIRKLGVISTGDVEKAGTDGLPSCASPDKWFVHQTADKPAAADITVWSIACTILSQGVLILFVTPSARCPTRQSSSSSSHDS